MLNVWKFVKNQALKKTAVESAKTRKITLSTKLLLGFSKFLNFLIKNSKESNFREKWLQNPIFCGISKIYNVL